MGRLPGGSGRLVSLFAALLLGSGCGLIPGLGDDDSSGSGAGLGGRDKDGGPPGQDKKDGGPAEEPDAGAPVADAGTPVADAGTPADPQDGGPSAQPDAGGNGGGQDGNHCERYYECDEVECREHGGGNECKCCRREVCDGLDNDHDGVTDDGFPDADGDGIANCVDPETCDGLENDGDGEIDEGWPDTDGDGTADCVDAEECDGLDNDGNGRTDDGFPDADRDGVADCVDEEECDGRDNNGDGAADEGFGDSDEDGVADCVDVEACDGLDNDGDDAVDEGFPDSDQDGTADCVGVEICDGRNNDADGLVDEGFPDTDGDGTADCVDVETCDAVDNDGDGGTDDGFTDTDEDGIADCVDVEECDGLDNDGDAAIDEGYPDADRDGWADCVDPETCDGVDNNGNGQTDEDFDDTDADGVADCMDVETCDGLDNDGDGGIDEGFPDSDGDGVANCQDFEECDGLDNDGDALTDEGFADTDRDGIRDCADEESCDGLDNDGDGETDEGFDVDGDTFADCLEACRTTARLCSAPGPQHRTTNGAPAVATWAGHVSWNARIPGAAWIWDQYVEPVPGVSREVRVRRPFPLHATATDLRGTLQIAADNSYRVALNGAGAWSDPGEFNYYAPADRHDVSAALRPGANALEFAVTNMAAAGATSWDNPGGLLYCLDLAWTYEKDPEECDGLDNDCDGRTDEGFADSDWDGVADCVDAEECDRRDNDGDGQTDEGFDSDGNGRADCTETCTGTLRFCSAPDGKNVLETGAPAVETWSGNARWTAAVRGAKWIWNAWHEPTPARGSTHVISRGYQLPSTARSIAAKVVVAADNSYDVYSNGRRQGGDGAEFNYFAPADTWPLQNAGPGANRLDFRVVNWAQPRGSWATNPGGLLYCAELSYAWIKDAEACDGVDNDCDRVVDEGCAPR